MDKSVNKREEGKKWRGLREGMRGPETETKGGGESRDTLNIQIIEIKPKRFWLVFCKWSACKK